MCTTGNNDTGGIATDVNNTGGKFANNMIVLLIPVANLPLVSTSRHKFGAVVNDTGGNFPQVSTTPAANLPPVSPPDC
jgi:hypothetical protein